MKFFQQVRLAVTRKSILIPSACIACGSTVVYYTGYAQFKSLKIGIIKPLAYAASRKSNNDLVRITFISYC